MRVEWVVGVRGEMGMVEAVGLMGGGEVVGGEGGEW